MNKVILMGRLTRDPEIRYSQGDSSLCIARYSLAVDRRASRNNSNNEQTADFINCVCFGKLAEHAEKYYHKGIKIAAVGRIQTGSYTNKDGVKVYTTEVVVEESEFAESKGASQQGGQSGFQSTQGRDFSKGGSFDAPQGGGNDSWDSDFMNTPETIDDDVPF